MLASLLSPAQSTPSSQPAQGRISQLLPTVKCSSCHQLVPLADLGEHICAPPPPVPSLPKSSGTPPPAGSSVLPERLQTRVPPSDPQPPLPAASSSRFQQPQQPPPAQRERSGSTSASINSRLRVNSNNSSPSSPTKPSFQHKPSPLSRTGSGPEPSTSRVPFPPDNRTPSPAINQPPGGDYRARTPSAPGSNYSTPTTARPPVSFNREPSPGPGHGPIRNGTPGPPPHMRNGTPGPPPPGPPPPGPPPGPPMPGGPMRGPGMNMPPRNGPPPMNNGMPPPMRNGPSPAPSMGYAPRPGPPPNMGPPRGPPPPTTGIPPQGRPPHMPPPPNGGYPPRGPNDGPSEQYVHPAERGINTKSGGEAGMAGVGRRGFAAAARAAMFVHPPHSRPTGPMGPGQYMSRPGVPQFLDIDAASRSTDTPPLSAGSGYSSHSPGPTSPSLAGDFPSQTVPVRAGRTPSPPVITAARSQAPSKPAPLQPVTPISSAPSPLSARLPFFEKFKNKIPGMGANTEPIPLPPTNIQDNNTISNSINNNPPAPSGLTNTRPRANTAASTSSRANSGLGRSETNTSSASRRQRARGQPPSPRDSESEYSGLAYADSTDYEDDDEFSRGQRNRTPPPLPNSMERTKSGASSKYSQGSLSNRPSRVRQVPGMQVGGPRDRSRSRSHARDHSASSYSSMGSNANNGAAATTSSNVDIPTQDDALKRSRSNSSAIAQALGLSQTPPSEYAKLGGPGVSATQKRLGRSFSGSSNESGASKSAYSRDTTLSKPGGHGFDKAMETLMEDINAQKVEENVKAPEGLAYSRSQHSQGSESGSASRQLRARAGTAGSSASAAASASRNRDPEFEPSSSMLNVAQGGARTQRSNTVQAQSPDAKAVKLPMRSLTSPRLDSDKTLADGTRPKKVRKPKVCLKCQKIIEDGRWVSVDNGGVLCEKDWKHMYLPKCRRCNLPIEKQAVSSSDGQLKGKYHKECFNCHKCHKPFPDKTFYVYDGKPLCAYHYHEANDSLCAAARCGQPIEGPCAVSHTGDRYHPEHMTCEYPGYPDCKETLSEYWEVDGRMLCEKHAVYMTSRRRSGLDADDMDEEEERWAQSERRAMKRITRFIDLNNGVTVGGAAAAATRGDDDDDLR